MHIIEQQFLSELDKKLWNAADRLRMSMDAANYKHIVLGLIFLKYVSDAFDERKKELRARFLDPADEYYLPREDYDTDADYEAALQEEIEQRDYYTEKNVFWVPVQARWDNLGRWAVFAAGTDLPWPKPNGERGVVQPEKMRSVSWLIDNALEAVETENKKLKGVLNRISGYQVGNETLIGLINSFSDTSFHNPVYKGQPLNIGAKDILGHVYEYFLGEFALAEGKKGGQYFTPKSIVSLIVEMLQPFRGRIYDPAMGSGGFFVQSEKFIEEHGGKLGDVSVYGQEYNPTTWRLAAMNMAIRGIDFDFGKRNADSFTDDQHPDLRADYVMANPPFNIREWWHKQLDGDPRWLYGTPPQSNANFGWIQHMLYHLNDTGSMALLLANGSMSSSTNNEGEIRKALIDADLVECMVALPGQLFTNTQIPACIWLLTKNKRGGPGAGGIGGGDNKSAGGIGSSGTGGVHPRPNTANKRNRTDEVLFIDARKLGYMKDRVLRDFTTADTAQVSETFHNWQAGNDYADVPGFCYSATKTDIQKHDYVLTPGRYVGATEAEDDGIPFAQKMAELTAKLGEQFRQSAELEKQIEVNLKGLGYEW